MADHDRHDVDESRHRGGQGGGMFGSRWSGMGPDPRGEPAWSDGPSSWTGRSEERGVARGERGRTERDYGYDDRHEGLPIEETSRLIASNKVEGTTVYSRDGERLGTIYNFMVDKRSGQVEYAVMRYGGLLGIGQRYYPLPWRVLTYHRDTGGYVIDMRARDFEDAPSFDRDTEPRFDREYGRRVHSWYGLDY
jgi:sporulation protein YlmC with PRC-barrel domain